jgi:subtilisin family serine protease
VNVRLLSSAALAASLLAAPAGAAAAADPLLPRQWNLAADGIRAQPSPVPPGTRLHTVTVAVVDGGVDDRNPDLRAGPGVAAIVPRRVGFVAGQALTASTHATLVAGIIGAHTGNGVAIAGVAPRVRILDLQVVHRGPARQGEIDERDEAAAIRYAVAHGARVINLSLGAGRNPNDPEADAFSPIEAAAVREAVRKGVLVVAAAGNEGDVWANWPAALPHVMCVAASDRDRRIADFSNRDPRRIDVAAPGDGVISLVPTRLAASGVSTDAPGGDGIIAGDGTVRGTSFAVPHVTAAAALLFSLRPSLRASQVAAILEQSARDVGPRGHDSAAGFGEIDLTAAVRRVLAGRIPRSDRLEPNDDGGTRAARLPTRRRVALNATASAVNDEIDVYRVRLRKGQRLDVRLRGQGGRGTDLDLLVFRPATTQIAGLGPEVAPRIVAGSTLRGSRERVRYTAARAGTYPLVVWASAGGGGYRLVVSRSSSAGTSRR